MKMTEML